MYTRLRLGSLVSILIQSAILSADDLGFGQLKLIDNNLFWVLSRLTIEISNPLKWYDKVEVATWPKDVNGLLYLRDFQIKHKGKTIVNATSGWLAVDMESKRPKNIEISGSDLESFTKLKDVHALRTAPEKLNEVSKGDTFNIIPSYYDLDINNHVTSSRYIDWMMDTFTPEFHKHSYPRSLSINYLKEIRYGKRLDLLRSIVSNNEYTFEGIHSNKDSPAFRGKLSF